LSPFDEASATSPFELLTELASPDVVGLDCKNVFLLKVSFQHENTRDNNSGNPITNPSSIGSFEFKQIGGEKNLPVFQTPSSLEQC
jgi:hypothetical protein